MSLIEGNREEPTRHYEQHQARRPERFGSALMHEPFDGDSSVLDVLVTYFPLKPGKRADAYGDLLEELDSDFQRPVDLSVTRAIKTGMFSKP